MQPQLGIQKRFYQKFIRCGQMQPQLGIQKRFIKSLLVVDRFSLSWGFARGLLEVYQRLTDAASAGDLEEVYQKFIKGGQMQPQLGIWKRFIINLSVVDRCSLSWGSGRGLLEVYQQWTDAASARELEEVCYKFISGGQIQPQLGIWKGVIRSLSGVDRCILSWRFGRGLFEVYQWWTDADSSGDVEEVDQKFMQGGQTQPLLGI